jgi:MATE family multidrug resistance protein
MIIQVVCLPLHILWCYILTDVYEMGINGTAISSSFTNLIIFIMFWIYSSLYTEQKLKEETWFLPRNHSEIMECCNSKSLWEFFKFGVGSIGTICLEWWSFEFMMLFSSYISVKATATQIILMNTCSLCFMLPLGL